jgi:hypothetical protein
MVDQKYEQTLYHRRRIDNPPQIEFSLSVRYYECERLTTAHQLSCNVDTGIRYRRPTGTF